LRRIREPGASSTTQVRVERELADQQEAAACLSDRSVGAAGIVLEVAQAEQLIRHAVDELLRVPAADPDQDHRARADRTDRLRADPHGGAADALDDKAHRA
jgi:hypothetical protein